MNKIHLILWILASILISCNENSRLEPDRPSLSADRLELIAGRTSSVELTGAVEYSVSSTDENVAIAEKSGKSILVRAISPGSATIEAYISRTLTLRIAVTVIANEEGNDFGDELDDDSMRFTCEGTEMRYSEGGIIFQISTDSIIEGHDLGSGKFFRFDMHRQELTMNGEYVRLSQASVAKRNVTTTWFNLTSYRTGKTIVLVINDL